MREGVEMTAEEKLKIAVKCLKQYAKEDNWSNIYDTESFDYTPLYWYRKYKKSFGYKQAQNALKRIGE